MYNENSFLCHDIFSDGGVQRVITTLSNSLSSNYEVDIICTSSKANINFEKYGLNMDKINVIKSEIEKTNKINKLILKFFRGINLYTNLFNNVFLYKILCRIYYPNFQRNRLRHLIEENQYDIVVGCEGYYSILLGLLTDSIEAKTIGWFHNSFEAYLNTKNKYCWNRDILLKKIVSKNYKNIVLTNSDKDKYLDELGLVTEVIHNPLGLKCKNKSSVLSNVVIAAGRLNIAKRILTF